MEISSIDETLHFPRGWKSFDDVEDEAWCLEFLCMFHNSLEGDTLVREFFVDCWRTSDHKGVFWSWEIQAGREGNTRGKQLVKANLDLVCAGAVIAGFWFFRHLLCLVTWGSLLASPRRCFGQETQPILYIVVMKSSVLSKEDEVGCHVWTFHVWDLLEISYHFGRRI